MPQWCYGCLLVVVALISGCGDPVENAIEGLIAGGDQAEKARMELNLAKRAAIAPTEAGADPLSFALCRASVVPSIDDRLPEEYAAATNAVGQIASGEAADNTTPPPIAAPSLRLASFLIRSISRSFCLRPSQRLDLSRQMRPNGISLRDLIELPLLCLL